MRSPFARVFRSLAIAGPILVGPVMTARGQEQIPPEHHWTDIGTSGQTSVDWTTLERHDMNTGGPVFLIWAHTEENGGSVVVRVAVHCGPRHAAVVEVRRARGDGSVESAGPVPLTDLQWQDPPPRSYLAAVESAVCAHTREARVRPC
jgi:hypothetical protein